MNTTVLMPGGLAGMLQADPASMEQRISNKPGRLVWQSFTAVIVGAGLYGAAMGSWWSPLQALFVAIKLPLLILLTTAGNGLLNGMLAPLLGLSIGFRQSAAAVLMSFGITSIILGALSPLAWFAVWNTPGLSAKTWLTSPEYNFLQLLLVGFVAFAGIVGNVRLRPLLDRIGGSRAAGRKVLLAWLASNLFLGSQLCWLLRPFVWDPAGPPRFIGREYLHGSFYETIFNALLRIGHGVAGGTGQ
jgi:hypothetical protein